MSTIVYAGNLHGNREADDQLFALKADAVVPGGDLLPYPLRRGGDLLEPGCPRPGIDSPEIYSPACNARKLRSY